MKIQTIKNLFSPDTLLKVQEEYKKTIESREMDFCVEFGRLYKNGQPYFNHLHRTEVFEKAKKLWGEDIIPSYTFMSHYHMKQSICPQHRDRFPQCLYTIDVVVDQIKPWGIFVDFKEHIMEINEACCYSGVNHHHHRGLIEPGNKVSLLFFHYTDSIHAGRNLN